MDFVVLSGLVGGKIPWQQGATPQLSVIAKLTLELRPGQMTVSPQQRSVTTDDVYWDGSPSASLREPSDLVPQKPRVDFIVVGHAIAPQGRVGSLLVGLLVGEDRAPVIDRRIQVSAERAFGADGNLAEGPPFARLPLRYEYAASGPDGMNPVGIRPNTPDLAGRYRLPQLLPAGMRFPTPRESIPPLGFGPIAPHWPSRVQELHGFPHGQFVQSWRAQPYPQHIGFAYFNAAPREQQLPGIQPNERIVITNMVPNHSVLETRLPNLQAIAFIDPDQGSPPPLPMSLDTVWIDCDQWVCTLTWRLVVPEAQTRGAGRVVLALHRGPASMTHQDAAKILAEARGAKPTSVKHRIPPTLPTDGNPLEGTMQIDPEIAKAVIGALDDEEPGRETRPIPEPAPIPAPAPPRSRQDLSKSANDWAATAPVPPSLSQSSGSWPSSPHAAPSAAAQRAPLPVPPAPPPPASAHLKESGSFGRSPFALKPDVAPAPPAPAPPPRVALPPEREELTLPPTHMGGAAHPFAPIPAAVVAPAPANEDSPWARGGYVPAEPAPEPPPKLPERPLLRARPAETRTISLLWYDEESVPRIRKRRVFREILDAIEKEKAPIDPDLDDGASDPWKIEDRRDIFEILVRGTPVTADGLEAVRREAIRPDGKYVPPIVLFEGEIEMAFDEMERLKATVSTAAPLARDEGLLKAIKDADEFLARSNLLCSDAVPKAMSERIVKAFRAGRHEDVGAEYLEEQVVKVLAERRLYVVREVFGASHAVARVASRASGVAISLPRPALTRLPLTPQFRGRTVCTVEDHELDGRPAHLRVLALALSTCSAAPELAR